jgi:hypothetical protein
MSDTDTAWGVLVQAPDMKRGEWLTPDGHLTHLRVHAGIVRGEAGRQTAERQAASIEASNPGTKAKARRF